MTAQISIPVAPGELIDKLTILAIKDARIDDAEKRANVQREFALLDAVRQSAVPDTEEIRGLTDALRAVNETLWDVEDRLRDMERAGTFDSAFVEDARLVYKTNDRRAALKREINLALGSEIVEEKSYAPY